MNDWPAIVDEKPEAFRRALDQNISLFKGLAVTRHRADTLNRDGERIVHEPHSNSELRQDALQILKKADELLGTVRKFYAKSFSSGNGLLGYDNYRDEALERIESWIPDVSDEERMCFHIGTGWNLGSHPIDHALIGLCTHMEVIAEAHKGKDSRGSHLRWAFAKRLVMNCAQAGLCVDPDQRIEYRPAKEIIRCAFARVNEDCPEGKEILRPLPTKVVNSISRAYLAMGDSMEYYKHKPQG